MLVPGPFYYGYKGRIWPGVVAFLTFVFLLPGLDMIGYRPVVLALNVFDRFFPLIWWTLIAIYLLANFWARPK